MESLIILRHGSHRKHLSRDRLRIHWPVTSAGRGADDIENTASSIVVCWTVFTEPLPGNTLIKSVAIYKVCVFSKMSTDILRMQDYLPV
jgi:hypothetical protein